MKHKLIEMIAFGERLIQTQDLDPVYVALVGAKLPADQMKRLLLAYFCFYHLGVSARLSEATGAHYWDLMEIAARNKLCNPDEIDPDLPEGKWPRGAERRHFRGEKCVAAIVSLGRDRPEQLIETLIDGYDGSPRIKLPWIMGRIQCWPMFGEWISFKAADMLERILKAPIEFPNDLALIYKEPRAALSLLDLPAEQASTQLLTHFGKIKAPPDYDRFCNIQETETILCKTKAFWNGKYWLGKDIHEIRKGLLGWGATSNRLLTSMPPEVEGGLFG